MGQDILTMLYYGKIAPWESGKAANPEAERLKERAAGETSRLEQMLDGEGRRLLEQLQDDSAQLEGQAACEAFRDGFRLGAQIMLAALGAAPP